MALIDEARSRCAGLAKERQEGPVSHGGNPDRWPVRGIPSAIIQQQPGHTQLDQGGVVAPFGPITRKGPQLGPAPGIAPLALQQQRIGREYQHAAERVVPIVMTALVTGIGLLPLALSGGGAGREIESPMACVILGGLATSTVLNLLVLPGLAWRWGRFTPRA